MTYARNPQFICVILHLHSPKEKYWGILHRNSPTGVWLSGIDLKTLEDWIQRWSAESGTVPMLATTFFPMHRLEKITLDETIGEIPSLVDTLLGRLGRDIAELLPAPFILPGDIQ
jgi:hypothetical protein